MERKENDERKREMKEDDKEKGIAPTKKKNMTREERECNDKNKMAMKKQSR